MSLSRRTKNLKVIAAELLGMKAPESMTVGRSRRNTRTRMALYTAGLMVAAFAVASAPIVASTAAAHPPPAPTLSAHLRAVLARDVRLHAGPAMQRRTVGTTKGGIKVYDTNNWSGYVAVPRSAGTQFLGVSAVVEQPAVNCSATTGQTFAYQWVGLDGWSSADAPGAGLTVEQAGVAGQCVNNQPVYFAWYETFPGPVQIEFAASPGDSLNVGVTHPNGSNEYAISVNDFTTGQYFDADPNCEAGSTCENGSAEVITEGYTSAPWEGTSDFGVEPYTGIHVAGITPNAAFAGTLKNGNFTTVKSQAIGAVSNEATTSVGPLDNSKTESAFAIYWQRED